MISLGRDFVTAAWWLATQPGIAIQLTVPAKNQGATPSATPSIRAIG
jgi:ABC-type dipeptide/oligopeptide/nickel transport system permease subunit